MDSWFKPRGYAHFDQPLGIKSYENVKKYVSSPDKVEKHGFYPLISYDVTKYKITEDEDTKKRYLDNTGTRELCYAAHIDAQIYSYYSKNLNEKYETLLKDLGIDSNVIAFRKLTDLESGHGMCNIHLAKQAFMKIGAMGNVKAFAFDVSKFFDSLNPEYLKLQWCKVLGTNSLPNDHYKLFKNIVNQCKINLEDIRKAYPEFHPTEMRSNGRVCPKEFLKSVKRLKRTSKKGIPQGLPISALLANIYMLEFDSFITKATSDVNGFYFRYCDDILILVPSDDPSDWESLVKEQLQLIHLDLNVKKSKASTYEMINSYQKCDKPIQYLGFQFDGRNVSIRSGSVSKFLRKFHSELKLGLKTRKKYNSVRFGKGLSPEPLYRRKLFSKYSQHGKQNFISYVNRAAEVFDNPSLKKQLKNLNKQVEAKLFEAKYQSNPSHDES